MQEVGQEGQALQQQRPHDLLEAFGSLAALTKAGIGNQVGRFLLWLVGWFGPSDHSLEAP